MCARRGREPLDEYRPKAVGSSPGLDLVPNRNVPPSGRKFRASGDRRAPLTSLSATTHTAASRENGLRLLSPIVIPKDVGEGAERFDGLWMVFFVHGGQDPCRLAQAHLRLLVPPIQPLGPG